ncbi:IS66 family transposase zinc-finger binding domain-containing protein, partial [Bacillus cereus]|uniref:IS66 family transposase zinc-finger binding domain-containing protein n=1 Tax=Bacillus cereus TaxID=1396 RepID=UPI0021123D38|nr:IS66 family transposase zinc-finger binding domain-containing protein [Bacillus cereus]
PTHCTCCNTSLHQEPVKGYPIRQVYDLPPIQIEVTEHKVEKKECPHCHFIQESEFPSTCLLYTSDAADEKDGVDH